jgi:uncharacterized protein YprB with RNaseH-like and TPR domain
VDLSSRLRSIVRPGGPQPAAPQLRRELTYEPDTGAYESVMDLDRVADILAGRAVRNRFGACLVIERRYESDRFHGDIQIGDCELDARDALSVLDPSLSFDADLVSPTLDREPRHATRTVFIDLETTGLSGGAGIVAFLVGCGYFDLGAFQTRQFLLTSYSAERALLAAAAEFFEDADLIVTFNGKTFDLPVMETRWIFHRMEMPLDGVPHFDMLHPARRLWRSRAGTSAMDEGGCRLTTLERVLMGVRRVGDVSAFEIPSRFFRFLRTGDPRPLEPVLEHNRLDLVSLAAVTGRAARLAREGDGACRDSGEALALGTVFERAGAFARAEACYRRALVAECVEHRAEALYRLGLRCRRERRFSEAAEIWREVVSLTEAHGMRRRRDMSELRQFAIEALAIHHEHRARDLDMARELAMFALEEAAPASVDGIRHRLARIDRKLARKKNAQLFS